MFCAKCGAELKDSAKFCGACGTPVAIAEEVVKETVQPIVTENVNTNATTTPVEVDATPVKPAKEPKEKKPVNKKIVKIISIVAAVVVAAIVALVVVLNQPKKIKLDKYIKVEFTGYDGRGVAEVTLDKDGLKQELIKKLKLNTLKGTDISSLVSAKYQAQLKKLNECLKVVDYEVDNTTGLKNGDKVVVKLKYDNSKIKKYKLKYTGSSKTYTVLGLEEIKKVDVFDGLKITYSGISPSGYMEYSYSGNENIAAYNFEFDKTRKLRNGDKITCTYTGDDDYTAKKGFIAESRTKEFEVSGLSEYVLNEKDLDDNVIKILKSDSLDAIESYIARQYSEKISVSELTDVGNLFMSIKADKEASVNNAYYAVYKATLSNSGNDFKPTVVYYVVRINNVIKLDDGWGYEDPEMLGSSNLQGYYSTNGYVVPMKLYKEIVVSNQNNYEFSMSDSIKAFEKYTPIEKISDISTDNIKKMALDATDYLESYIADKDWDDVNYTTEVYGKYLLTLKTQAEEYDKNNIFYIIYKVTFKDEDGNKTVGYFPIKFSGLINLDNDEFIVLYSCDGIAGDGFDLTESYHTFYDGYDDIANMYKDIITANRDNYKNDVVDPDHKSETTDEKATEEVTEE